jgi:hypothetical protein
MSGRSRRTRRIAGALALPLLFVGVLVGCELIVSGDLPTYTCTGTDPSSCPSGMTCNAATSTCVPSTDPGNEGGPSIDAPTERDTSPTLAAIGAPCTTDVACQSNLCGTASVLTSAIVTDQGSVCTTPCCTTADCPTDFVCYATATGGNYCVAATNAGRTPPNDGGGGNAGANCTANSDCRSGLCSADDHCVDTCCRNEDCNAGTVCKFFDKLAGPAGTTHIAWACAPPNAGGNSDGQQCPSQDLTECQNNNCVLIGGQNVCDPFCCTTNDCAKAGLTNYVCGYSTSQVETFKECFAARDAGAEGANCSTKLECSSNFCDSTGKCARPCCRSSDCNTGESCKPADGTPFLRCVKNP